MTEETLLNLGRTFSSGKYFSCWTAC